MPTLENFESLESILQKICGDFDAPLFVQSMENAGIHIQKISYSEKTQNVSLKDLSTDQIRQLQAQLAICQTISVTGRSFSLKNSYTPETVSIPCNEFQSRKPFLNAYFAKLHSKVKQANAYSKTFSTLLNTPWCITP